MFERIVLITRKTRLEGLIERFNTKSQAQFYIEHSGGDFQQYQDEHDVYKEALGRLRKQIDFGLKILVSDIGYVPNVLFTNKDLIITIGQDGLVANTAKYVGEQPIVAINPDPKRFDGILLPFAVSESRRAVSQVLEERSKICQITLAEARLNDGQSLLAFNDLYVGVNTHTSARYHLSWNGKEESQSSSGIIISTGAGSTGWLSSIVNMTAGMATFLGQKPRKDLQLKMEWDSPNLVFVVREPFASRHSQASIVAGKIKRGHKLTLESNIPSGGCIFSDGVHADFLNFNAGTIAEIGVADHCARLVVPSPYGKNTTSF